MLSYISSMPIPCFLRSLTAYPLFQVICWFQNRRAKFKRDMEELKKDVEKTPLPHPSHHQGGGGGPPQHPSPHHHGLPRPPVQFPLGGHPGIPSSLGSLVPTSLAAHPSLLLLPHLILADRAAGLHHHRGASPPITSPESGSPPIRVEDSD